MCMSRCTLDSIDYCGADVMDEACEDLVLCSEVFLNLWLPSSVMALPVREFTQLHYSCHGMVPQEKLWVTVTRLQKEIVLKRKRRQTVEKSSLSELPIPGQMYIKHLVQKSMQNTGSLYHESQCHSS